MITTLALSIILAPGPWRPVDISFYDSGTRTADGTPMALNGRWLATRAFPLGTKVEVEYRGRSLTLVVRDRTARRFGGRADLPVETWDLFGVPRSTGILRGRWRVVR